MRTKNTPSGPKAAEARIRVQVASRSSRIPAAARIRAWVRAATTGAAEITIRFVGPTEARQLNRAYRGRDYATNVLTFAYAPDRADIVLCPQVLLREARAQAKSLDAHYAHLTVHAILHMRGHEHVLPADAARMERAEIRILKRLGYPNPYLI